MTPGDDEGHSEGRLVSRNTLLPPASVGPSSPLVRRRKKRDLMEVMEEEAQELLSFFNHRNVDALFKLIRNTLELLRKRVQGSAPMHFSGDNNYKLYIFFLTIHTYLLKLKVKCTEPKNETK